MKCKKCGKEYKNKFDYENMDKDLLKVAYRIEAIIESKGLCHDCDHEEKQNLKAIKVKTNWSIICPKLYRDTDPSRLNNNLLKTVNNWQFGSKGLGIVGDSGAGKTRAIFWRLRREYDEGRSIHYRCATDLANRFGSITPKRAQEKEDCKKADILFIDDIDKPKYTECVEADLFDVLENRSKRKKLLIWTSNSTSRELGQKFSPTHRDPILRRLTDTCDIKVHEPQYEYAN